MLFNSKWIRSIDYPYIEWWLFGLNPLPTIPTYILMIVGYWVQYEAITHLTHKSIDGCWLLGLIQSHYPLYPQIYWWLFGSIHSHYPPYPQIDWWLLGLIQLRIGTLSRFLKWIWLNFMLINFSGKSTRLIYVCPKL